MERKVRIISISGQPLSGKSTAIDKITELLKEKGIKEEDIHVVSVGKKFREYFNKIMDLASDLKNKSKEELKEISVDEELKQFCSNQLLRKKMKEALVNLLMSDFDFNKFDIEKANNSPELKEIRDLIDTIVDTKVAELGEEAIKNNKENEVWIMDSRLAFSNIPESFAVRLTVRDDVAGKRLFEGTRKRGKEDNNYADVKEAMEKTIKRGQGEEIRYKERYGVELSNEDNYNLIIDTSFSNVDDIAKTILTCEECEREGKLYSRNWASPKIFIPTQSADKMKYRFDPYLEKLEKEGYAPNLSIDTIKTDEDIYVINDGHTRLSVLAYNGVTLIPYHVYKFEADTAKTLGCTKGYYLADVEECFRCGKNPEPNFSYEDIYPGIYDRIREANKKQKDEEER